MTKDEAIEYFGSRAELGRRLGIDGSNITRWKHVPTWHQKAIERMTNGRLKADKQVKAPKPETQKVCYFIPKENYKEFKKLCHKEKVSMCRKVNEMIENLVTSP